MIRTVDPNEIDITVNLVKYYYDEAAEAMPNMGEWDTNSVIRTIRNRTINPAHVWLNMYEGTRPIGMISGSIALAPWNEDIVMGTIEMFYILKSHRNMDRFRELVSAYEEWAAMSNTKLIYVSDMGINESRTATLYQQLGYDTATSLVKRID
jgi:GNAT superfamily N-acetyltransferase